MFLLIIQRIIKKRQKSLSSTTQLKIGGEIVDPLQYHGLLYYTTQSNAYPNHKTIILKIGLLRSATQMFGRLTTRQAYTPLQIVPGTWSEHKKKRWK